MPHLVVHGHFYQPPRENPWTEEIDREPSADPYHDWNERITAECYHPNAFARVLADDGRVVDILNNYAWISFNFGPTLLSWIRAHAPDVYARIRQGDAHSLQRLGHGNALAQAYNHLILPLANRRDKVTQVRWGLADFRFHFGREAEALWLPETAVDLETLEVLAEAGLRYAILAPTQAGRVRPRGSGDAAWQTVEAGSLDTSRAYLCRLPGGRQIALFFYDGGLAHAASYGDLLSSSQGFVSRMAAAVDPRRTHPQLIHLATDGETFGHHKKFAELSLIYALSSEAAARGLSVTNYGTYLDLAPPQWEVEILPGTAWSCAHGLGRWSADCGCTTGGPPGGHQRWRAPLRAALDHLRDTLAEIYAREAPPLLGDPWAARNAFGQVLPDRTPERLEAFLAERAGRRLSADEHVRALTLLEMQRHAMLMYTSCGWFFADISNLETAQVLKYAARAIDLAGRFGASDLAERLLTDLERAESNDPGAGTGAGVYRKQVLPAAIGPARVAASYAINALVDSFPVRHRRHAYLIEQLEGLSRQVGDYRLVCGHLRLTSQFTSRQSSWTYVALHLGGYNFAASVIQCDDPQRCRELCTSLVQEIGDQSAPALLQLLQARVGPQLYGLGDLPPSDRRRLMKRLEQDVLESLAGSYEQIYTDHLGTIQVLTAAHMLVPPELRLAAEFTLSHRLAHGARELAHNPTQAQAADLRHILALASRDQLRLELGWARAALEQAVTERVMALVHGAPAGGQPEPYRHISRLIGLADGLGFDLRPARAQELLLDHLRQAAQGPAWDWSAETRTAALELADTLRLSLQAVPLPEPQQ